MKKITIAAGLFLLAGCGAASKNTTMDAAYAESPAPSEPTPAQDAPPPPAGEMTSVDSGSFNYESSNGEKYQFDYDVDRPAKTSESAERPMASVPLTSIGTPGNSASTTESPPPLPIENGKVDTKNDPMIIYSGYLQLRVRRLIEAQDQIQSVVEKRGGYIDSLTKTTIVVRIPGIDFESMMTELAGLGELLSRWVRAQDVTLQFTDLRARLDVAEKSRERLLKLLDKVDDVAERLRILQEIKRLSEQIDTIDSSLAAIRNLVDYFTITIDLVPILEADRMDTGLSPFAWIRELRPHLQTMTEGKKAFAIKLPKGFVLFEKEEAYLAQSADTSVIRAASLTNEPKGDNAFWIDAVDFEMTTRQEKIEKSGTEGKFVYRLYENDDVTPRFYLVALTVLEDKIYVIEVFFPNADAKDAHFNSVIEMLKTAEVKP
jgi:hypothetical protein